MAQPARHGEQAGKSTLRRSKDRSHCRTASFLHFNRDFRFNSQSTSMQCTPRRTIGGRAWLSLKLKNKEQEKALAAWGNTSLGLLLYWWHANKQQSGRGSIGKAALQGLPTLDVRALTPAQLKAASKIFDDFSGTPLLTFSEIHSDSERQKLDAEFMTRALGLPKALCAHGALSLLRKKLSLEPSISG